MLLTTKNLTIGYGTYAVQTELALEAKGGTMICMLGKNGCGKSTLLRTLAGLQPALEGNVFIDSQDIYSLSQQQRATRLALVLTERLSIDNTTVHDVTAMGRYPYTNFLGGLTENDENDINTALNQVGMTHKQNDYFNRLSDG